MPAVADFIVHQLRDAGVTCLFGMPGGGSNLDLIEAAGRAVLPFVLTSSETAGALAAVAQAEVSGRLGACLTTLGPGVASVVNGVACALLDRAPLLVFTDSHPAAARGMFEHQRLDHHALLAPVTKWSASLTPDTVVQTLARAIDMAMAPPPGPVHLDCAADVTAVSSSHGTKGVPPDHAAGVSPNSQFDSLVARARRPLLLIGLGARRASDAAAVRALCEHRGVPAMVTYKAKGVVPDDHPLFAGVFTNGALEQPLLDEADLLIGVGLDPVELIPRPWTRQQAIVYCGAWEVERRHVPFAAQLVMDVPAGIRQIEELLQTSEWDPDYVRGKVHEQQQRICLSDDGLTAQRVVRIAAERLAPICRVTVDAGAHMFPATILWPVCEPNQMLISNGLSTMGFALPAAIGSALLDRSRPVVALTGDGGLLMCLAELSTAAREGLRVIVIVFSDAALSLIQIKQQQRHYRPAGVGLGAIAWPALASSLGVAAWSAATEAEFERSVEQALDCHGPSLIEARINPANYDRTLRAVRG